MISPFDLLTQSSYKGLEISTLSAYYISLALTEIQKGTPKKINVAWMEFETFISGTPKSFTITCGPNTNNIPKNFRLLGAKERGAGQLQLWEELYYGRINDKLAPKNGATLTLPIQNPGTYKTYRIECSGNPIDYSLAEFKLNY